MGRLSSPADTKILHKCKQLLLDEEYASDLPRSPKGTLEGSIWYSLASTMEVREAKETTDAAVAIIDVWERMLIRSTG
jgi:hypothetical protein